MKYPFFKQFNDSIYFIGKYMEIYIPKYFFDKEIAVYHGDKIDTIGMFNFMVFDEIGNTSKGSLHTLKLPMRMKFEYKSSFTVKDKSLGKGMKKSDYIVFTLEENTLFLDSIKKEKNLENSKAFIGLLHGGKIPPSISYENIKDLYLDVIQMNGTKLNNPPVMLELIIAELCRSKKDLSIPFRKEIGQDNCKVNEYSYVNINLSKLPSINSTFSAITFEDINSALLSSVKKNKLNEKEVESPLEKNIKY